MCSQNTKEKDSDSRKKDIDDGCRTYSCNHRMYFYICLIALAVFAAFTIIPWCSLKNNQERIVEQQQICCDSMFSHFSQLCSVKSEAYKDSVYNVSFQKRIVEDSLLLCQQLASSQKNIEYQLESQLHNIQHEFLILSLWAALLMIVFLVFSFYSLYKADDIIKQGRDGLHQCRIYVHEIDDLTTKAKKKINNLQNSISDSVESYKNELKIEIDNKYDNISMKLLVDVDKKLSPIQEKCVALEDDIVKIKQMQDKGTDEDSDPDKGQEESLTNCGENNSGQIKE